MQSAKARKQYSKINLNYIVSEKLLYSPDNPVPDHEEVEPDEQSQHSSNISYQGDGRVGKLLPLNFHEISLKVRH